MKRFSAALVCIVCSLFAVVGESHQQVAVIPLMTSKTMKNVITVAKSGGDFTDPAAALASVTDASWSNKYLIVIGPGSYTVTEPLEMKRYVSISGSGRYATTLTGSVAGADRAASCIISMAQFMQLTGMTIQNSSGGSYSVGIYSNDNGPFIIDDVYLYVNGGTTHNYGIYSLNESGFGAIVKNSYIVARGSGAGNFTYGAFVSDGYFEFFDTTLTALGGDSGARGLYNYGGTVEAKNTEFRASDATATNYGIFTANSGTTRVWYSDVTGTTYSIRCLSGSIMKVINSTVRNMVNGDGSFTCLNSNNGDTMDRNPDTCAEEGAD